MIPSSFDLSDRVVIITGGAGLLGMSHARAVHSAGGIPLLLDVAAPSPEELRDRAGFDIQCLSCDITDEDQIRHALAATLRRHNRVDVLINNAANNPKVEATGG